MNYFDIIVLFPTVFVKIISDYFCRN